MTQSLFRQPHHALIWRALNDMNAPYLNNIHAAFTGGTLLSMTLGEYRRSDDIDFIINPGDGYKRLRRDLFGQPTLAALSNGQDATVTWGHFRADQYGVRGLVTVEDTPIKFEMFVDNRIIPVELVSELNTPVPCLGYSQRLAQKLLANADRGLDRSAHHRDIMDIAMQLYHGAHFERSVTLAEGAYEVLDPLKKTLSLITQDRALRVKQYEVLDVHPEHRKNIADGLDIIAKAVNHPPLNRHLSEKREIQL